MFDCEHDKALIDACSPDTILALVAAARRGVEDTRDADGSHREWYCGGCDAFCRATVREAAFPGEYELECPECGDVVGYYRELIATAYDAARAALPTEDADAE